MNGTGNSGKVRVGSVGRRFVAVGVTLVSLDGRVEHAHETQFGVGAQEVPVVLIKGVEGAGAERVFAEAVFMPSAHQGTQQNKPACEKEQMPVS